MLNFLIIVHDEKLTAQSYASMVFCANPERGAIKEKLAIHVEYFNLIRFDSPVNFLDSTCQEEEPILVVTERECPMIKSFVDTNYCTNSFQLLCSDLVSDHAHLVVGFSMSKICEELSRPYHPARHESKILRVQNFDTLTTGPVDHHSVSAIDFENNDFVFKANRDLNSWYP